MRSGWMNVGHNNYNISVMYKTNYMNEDAPKFMPALDAIVEDTLMKSNIDNSKKRRLNNEDDDDGSHGGKSRYSKKRVTKRRKTTKHRKSTKRRHRRTSRK